ncbi:MAG: NAD(P)-dependent alcohol dehydrogenase [Piscirickettsiaceae bacterium]|nr:MAG: NAD(P)-dependent alcohol dehydrogenase [Piscirickettsiaceae bacterium]PCI72209.1 MAG: NAD(P)-dependent alcohol dehydrogenase [Piscirickettsiaceae bacterium]
MKAIVYNKYGSPDVLQIKEIEKPKPKDDEVLIKVHSAEVTKSDCEMRSFKFAVKWFWLPLRLAWGIFKPKKKVLGGYFSGQIEGVGKNVTKLVVGDKIFGATQMQFGAYGEYLCLPANYTLVKKPSNMSYEEAAAVPLGGLNALHFMRKANIKKGEKVLINGAGGSIGTFAIQIAKDMGAEVTAVDSSIKETILRQLGVNHFVDYTQENVTNQGKTYDVIFNMVANSRYADFVKILNSNGRYLMGNPKLVDMLRSVVTSKLTNKTAMFSFAGEKEEELITLRMMIEAGKIRSVIDKIYSLNQIVQAHQRVETEQRKGIVVLSYDL